MIQKPLTEAERAIAADLSAKANRVAFCVDLMRDMRWRRGKTGRELAALWGVAPATVEHYAAEASRIVRAEVTDPTEVSRTVCSALEKVLFDALSDNDRKSVISAAQTWATISGAKAAERHEIMAAAGKTPADARRHMRELFGEVTPSEPDAE